MKKHHANALSGCVCALLVGFASLPAWGAGDNAPGFVGVNLLSPLPALSPVPLSTLGSVLANLEPGLGVQGGVLLGDVHALEGRLSFGPNSDAELLFSTQLYESFYLLRALQHNPRGLYLGGGVRYWDLYNQLTDVHRNNLGMALSVGYRFDLGRLYLDLRLHEIGLVYTWTSDEHTLPGLATLADPWLPRVPVFSVDLGMEVWGKGDSAKR